MINFAFIGERIRRRRKARVFPVTIVDLTWFSKKYTKYAHWITIVLSSYSLGASGNSPKKNSPKHPNPQILRSFVSFFAAFVNSPKHPNTQKQNLGNPPGCLHCIASQNIPNKELMFTNTSELIGTMSNNTVAKVSKSNGKKGY